VPAIFGSATSILARGGNVTHRAHISLPSGIAATGMVALRLVVVMMPEPDAVPAAACCGMIPPPAIAAAARRSTRCGRRM